MEALRLGQPSHPLTPAHLNRDYPVPSATCVQWAGSRCETDDSRPFPFLWHSTLQGRLAAGRGLPSPQPCFFSCCWGCDRRKRHSAKPSTHVRTEHETLSMCLPSRPPHDQVPPGLVGRLCCCVVPTVARRVGDMWQLAAGRWKYLHLIISDRLQRTSRLRQVPTVPTEL